MQILCMFLLEKLPKMQEKFDRRYAVLRGRAGRAYYIHTADRLTTCLDLRAGGARNELVDRRIISEQSREFNVRRI